jgi:alpha-tubulin suppressor-like RCC1 family protein
MPGGATEVRRGSLRQRAAGGTLALLAAGIGALVPASQAALAVSQGVTSISAGSDRSCAIEDGKAYCWGDNTFGALGDGSTGGHASMPMAVDASGVLAGRTLTQISAGGSYTCALDTAGAAYCWGFNEFGQLGDGSTANSSVPVAVDASGALAGLTLTEISVGTEATCALDTAGAVYCWGFNQFGQLGDGDTFNSSVPVAVDTSGALAGKTITQISVGSQGQACALDSAGAAYCWGRLGLGGGLGDGSTSGSSVPVAVDTRGVLAGKTLTQISAGTSTCALDTAGAAYCWGLGTLGDGSTAESNVPVAVDTSGALAGRTLTQISAGGSSTCALDSAGAAYCWGGNDAGELGDGNTTNSTVPVAVDASGALAGQALTQISVGSDAACALDTVAAIYCWGGNFNGELGDHSTAAQSLVPVLTGPQAPTSVDAVPGNTSDTVFWAAPASLDGGTLTGFTATAAPGGAACSTTGATTCPITGLTQGVTYTITVITRTTAGDSGASAPAIFTAQPTGPIVSDDRSAKCVDDSGDSAVNDTRIVMWDCNGSAEQAWTVAPDGTMQVNGKCMDIYRDQKANKSMVELWTCTGGANQQWHAVNGTLVNPASGKCLDDPRFVTTDGTQLEIYTCNGGANQQWTLP